LVRLRGLIHEPVEVGPGFAGGERRHEQVPLRRFEP
jgi:hypothetical protein